MRREGRTAAMLILYQMDSSGDFSDAEAVGRRHFDNLDAESPEDVRAFALELVRGVVTHLPEIDSILESSSTNWRLARMSRVDRNVLRLAAAELKLRPDVPSRVVINEAIEIGKRYGTSESGAFINGVLDRVNRELRP